MVCNRKLLIIVQLVISKLKCPQGTTATVLIQHMRQSFFIRTARDWNTLSQHVVTLSTPVSFRGAIRQM